MELYGSTTSPFVRHCRIVLMQTGLTCDFMETPPKGATSPTKRVPYLQDGDLSLTDSASIVRHLREKARQAFLPDIRDYDRFCMVNTAADTSVNLYVLARDGVTPETSLYLKRQRDRVQTILAELDRNARPELDFDNDADLRLACYLDWVLFRNLAELGGFRRLLGLLEQARSRAEFAETAPKA